MKALTLLAAPVVIAGALMVPHAAHAQSFGVQIGAPPVYAPAPVYAPPVYAAPAPYYGYYNGGWAPRPYYYGYGRPVVVGPRWGGGPGYYRGGGWGGHRGGWHR